MHIPDGFLSDPTCTVTTALAVAGLGVGVAQLRRTENRPHAALVAATGAGIFAAQMVNVPVAPGTSGHLVGAALATALLGPAAAMLTMAVVLAIQCLAFADGGLSALGANVLNMAVLGVLVAEATRRALARRAIARKADQRSQMMGVAAAGFVSVLAAATACSIELAASGAHSLGTLLPTMLAVHLPIGLGEALITVAALAAIGAWKSASARRPDRATVTRRAAAGLGAALIVAVLVSPWASSAPDGLESVAERLGFATMAVPSNIAGLAPDYLAPGIGLESLATAVAGAIGVLLVCAASYGAQRMATCKVRKTRD